MKPPLKGYLLQSLLRRGLAWDVDLVAEAMVDYGLRGERANNGLHVALDELASAGLLERMETVLVEEMLRFRYRLTDFGRVRMADTGLLPEEETR